MKKHILKLILIGIIIAVVFTSFTLSSSAEDIVNNTQGDYYSLDFESDSFTKERVHINGIHKNILDGFESNYVHSFKMGQTYMSSPYFIDAEKTENTSSLCWASSAANMLQYSGWLNEVDKSQTDLDSMYDTPLYDINGEDAVFSHFVNNFDNKPSNTILALTWFFNNSYDPNSESTTIARPNGDGGLIPHVLSPYIIHHSEAKGNALLSFLTTYVDAGSATCILFNWRNPVNGKSGNHVITVWGYVYDSQKSADEEGYCLSLLYTDSDDDEVEDYSNPAENKLCKIDVKVCTAEDVAQNPMLKESDIGKVIGTNYTSNNMTLVASTVVTLAQHSVVADNFSTKVTTLEDSYSVADGEISLREAISYAKYTNTPVTFDQSFSGKTFALSSPISIKNKITIDASNLANRPTFDILDKTDEYGIFQIYDNGDLSVTGVNFTSSLPETKHISAVYNQGKLYMSDCEITGILSDAGAGIYNNGKLTLNNCVITNNTATQVGGGIYCAEGSTTKLTGKTIINSNKASGIDCNVFVNGQKFYLENLEEGTNIGLYLNNERDSVLCNVDSQKADEYLSYLSLDNGSNYSLELNTQKTQILINVMNKISLGCGSVSSSQWLPPLFMIIIGLSVLMIVKQKRLCR